MDEKDEDIVVLKYFNNAIDANIAKTKLDAYGIPCFLTEENMAGLYPGEGFLAFRIRLHLFASDRERADQILRTEALTVQDESAPVCPRCSSQRVTRAFPAKVADSLGYLIFGIFMPHKKVNVCADCGFEF